MQPPGALASWFECRQAVDRILQDNLPNTELETVFRQELQHILDRWAENTTGPPTVAQLPTLTCEAVGGDPSVAVPVVAAWQLVRLAAKLFDDIEDREADDRLALTLNAATSLLFAAPLALNELTRDATHDIAWRASVALERAMLRTAAGQHADLAGTLVERRPADPEAWLEIARAKSGELVAWAAWAGALVGGADERTQECLRQYGSALGILLQVADDYNGIWGAGGAGDLARGCLSLPVCYARLVLSGEARDRFETLFAQAGNDDKEAEGEAVKMLNESGALAFVLAVARIRYRHAVSALEQAGQAITTGRSLLALLDGVMPILACSGA